MKMKVGSLSFEAPQGFGWNETTVTLQAAPPKDLSDPRMLQKQAVAARANLVANQRTTETFKTIEAVVEDLTKRLTAAISTMQDLKARSITFDDGKTGILLSYLFSFNEKSMLRQLHAVRLDEHTVTTLVLTTPGSITEAEEKSYVKYLASATVGEAA